MLYIYITTINKTAIKNNWEGEKKKKKLNKYQDIILTNDLIGVSYNTINPIHTYTYPYIL